MKPPCAFELAVNLTVIVEFVKADNSILGCGKEYSIFSVGVGVGVGVGIATGVGVGVTTGVGDGVGVGVGVATGVGLATKTPLFQTSFLPLFTHVNFFPANVEVCPAFLQLPPALIAAVAFKGATSAKASIRVSKTFFIGKVSRVI